MDGSEKTKKSVLKFLFNLVLCAILFGGIASAVFLVVTGKYYKNNPEDESSITADSVSDVGTKAQSVDIDNTGSSGENNMTVSPVDVSALVSACEPAIVSVNNYVSGADEESAFNSNLQMYLSKSETGIIIGQNETSVMMLTSFHLLKNAEKITVMFYDGSEVEAAIKGCHDSDDIAVVCVKFSDMKKSTMEAIKIATMGSSTAAKAGQMVVSIGRSMPEGQSVSVGFIGSTAYRVEEFDMSLIRTDMKNETGGAIINSRGELIGFNMPTLNGESISEKGLVMPLDPVKEILLQIVQKEEKGEGESSYLGIVGTDIDEEYSLLLEMPEGINVKSIYADSPADKAGVEVGDVITAVNNTSIHTMKELADFLGYTDPGTIVTMYIQRLIEGEYTEIQLDVELDSVKNADKESNSYIQ